MVVQATLRIPELLMQLGYHQLLLINGSVGLLPDKHSEGPGFDSQPWQFIIYIYFCVIT